MNQVIKIGETALDLDSGTVISTSKRVANIGTLERQSSFTNKLNLPATANNLAAIGMVQGSDNSTKKYIKQLGTVSANGIEIMNAAQFSFESLSDRIELLINSDNAVFFDLIKKTLLREIDLIELDHLWTKTEIISTIGNDYNDGYIYAIHDSGYQSKFNGSLNCFGIVPSIFVKYLFEKIGLTFGYTFEGNIYNESYFENLLLPAINCFVGARNIEELKCTFVRNTPYNIPNTGGVWDLAGFTYNQIEDNNGGVFVDKWNVANVTAYSLQIPGEYEFVLDFISNVSGAAIAAAIKIKCVQRLDNEQTLLGESILTTASAGAFNNQIILNVVFDKFVVTTLNPNLNGSESTIIDCQVEFLRNATTNFQITNLTFKINAIRNAPVSHQNRLFNIQANLPNWSCGKFIKEISNLFGIIPVVNENNKTINLFTLNEIAENKTNAREWQSKIDLSNDIIYTFKIDGYGQKNFFNYLPDEDFGFEIDIENESLPKEINYIKSEFNYSIARRILQKPFNTIFLDNYNAETDLTADYTYSNMMRFNNKPRIAFLFSQNTSVIYSAFGEANNTQSVNIPFLGFQSQSFLNFHLEWYYLYETFYEKLFNGITDNILKIELQFRLTEFDIQDFDFSIPIYLENPSGFYYVQEIKDFTSSSESTSVELLRIG